MKNPFATMLGGEVLTYVRDAVIAAVTKKRSFLEQSIAIGGVALTDEERADLLALDAAADIIQFIVTAGQEAAARGREAPEWVLRAAAQARSTLAAPED